MPFSGFAKYVQPEPPVAQFEAISFCPPPGSTLLSRCCRDWEGPPTPSLFCRPNKPSSLSHSSMTDSPDPFPSPLLFSKHASAPQCLSCSAGPRTDPKIWGVASPVASTEWQSLPWSCWLWCSWSKPGCHWLSCVPWTHPAHIQPLLTSICRLFPVEGLSSHPAQSLKYCMGLWWPNSRTHGLAEPHTVRLGLNSLIQVIHKDIKPKWAQNWALSNNPTSDWIVDVAPLPTTLWPQSPSQFLTQWRCTCPSHGLQPLWDNAGRQCQRLCWNTGRHIHSLAFIH